MFLRRILALLWPNVTFAASPGKDEVWENFVGLFDHVTELYSVIHHTEIQEDKELAREILSDCRSQATSKGALIEYVYES